MAYLTLLIHFFCSFFPSVHSNLLWTAPEILETGVSHPDHVGYGTKEGDIYRYFLIVNPLTDEPLLKVASKVEGGLVSVSTMQRGSLSTLFLSAWPWEMYCWSGTLHLLSVSSDYPSCATPTLIWRRSGSNPQTFRLQGECSTDWANWPPPNPNLF